MSINSFSAFVPTPLATFSADCLITFFDANLDPAVKTPLPSKLATTDVPPVANAPATTGTRDATPCPTPTPNCVIAPLKVGFSLNSENCSIFFKALPASSS